MCTDSGQRDRRHALPWWSAGVSGSVAGISSSVVGHPLDTVKVELQQRNSSTCDGGVQALRKTIQESAQRGLFRGILPGTTVQLIITGLLFGVHENLSRLISNQWALASPSSLLLSSMAAVNGKCGEAGGSGGGEGSSRAENITISAAAGFLTGTVLSPIVCPLEALKCRAQAAAAPTGVAVTSELMELTPRDRALQRLQPRRPSMDSPSTRQNFRVTVNEYAAWVRSAALWQGWTATMLRCSVGNAAYFGTYVGLKGLSTPASMDHPPTDTTSMAAASAAAAVVSSNGAIAGVAFWTAAMPFDVVKTRQQVMSLNSVDGSGSKLRRAIRHKNENSYRILWRALCDIARREGDPCDD